MIVYRATPSFVFITSSFPRVASVNKQVLVDSELILHCAVHSYLHLQEKRFFFFMLFSHVLYFHYALMRPCHLCPVDAVR